MRYCGEPGIDRVGAPGLLPALLLTHRRRRHRRRRCTSRRPLRHCTAGAPPRTIPLCPRAAARSRPVVPVPEPLERDRLSSSVPSQLIKATIAASPRVKNSLSRSCSAPWEASVLLSTSREALLGKGTAVFGPRSVGASGSSVV
jgi:hypothetical protein